MNDFLPRAEPVASVVSATERGLTGVRGVTAATPAESQADANAQGDPQLSEKSAAAASYAKLQADIASVVARLDAPRPNASEAVGEADKALLDLMPQPVVVLPMPPTDQDMIEFVAQVAQSVASQAAMARAAQASITPALADAVIH